jgi:hypothetical protein
MGGLRLRRIALQYSGQYILNLQNEEEINAYMQFIFGDEMKTRVNTQWNTLSFTDGSNPSLLQVEPAPVAGEGNYLIGTGAIPPLYAFRDVISKQNIYGAECQIQHQSYILPLMHEGGLVMRGRHFENLPQYSGSALTLELDIINESVFYADREPNVCNNQPWVALSNGFQFRNFGGKDADTNVPQHYGPMFYPDSVAVPGCNINDAIPSNYYYGDVEITVTYIIAALIQNSNGMVELQI